MISSLSYFVTLLRKDFTEYCSKKLQEMGLTQGLLFFILYVGKHPGCSPKELAGALHMDTGHATRSIAKLEQGGFMEQKTNPKDKRAHILELTKKGQDAFRASHDLFGQWDDEMMKKMTPEQRQQLMTLLQELLPAGENSACIHQYPKVPEVE